MKYSTSIIWPGWNRWVFNLCFSSAILLYALAQPVTDTIIPHCHIHSQNHLGVKHSNSFLLFIFSHWIHLPTTFNRPNPCANSCIFLAITLNKWTGFFGQTPAGAAASHCPIAPRSMKNSHGTMRFRIPLRVESKLSAVVLWTNPIHSNGQEHSCVLWVLPWTLFRHFNHYMVLPCFGKPTALRLILKSLELLFQFSDNLCLWVAYHVSWRTHFQAGKHTHGLRLVFRTVLAAGQKPWSFFCAMNLKFK